MLFHRESGLLLHVTSLPGRYGIGEIGPDAVRWIEALGRMGQSLWQILPLGPTGAGHSPYQNTSTFAVSEMLLSLERMYEDGLLTRDDLDGFPVLAADNIDFDVAYAVRRPLLDKAAHAFATQAAAPLRAGREEFCAAHQTWLHDYALFVALKEAHGRRAWTQWPAALRDREPGALAAARVTYAEAIARVEVQQFLLARHWALVRAAARTRGIRVIGDIPIFIAHDSVDVWANRELFHLDEAGRATVVAGVPPDYFSKTGQRWGNPLYRWEAHAARSFGWWIARIRRALAWVDVIRIDHFRGFAAYWEIPAGERTAVHGRWVDGPKDALFTAAQAQLGPLPIIAEDLGLITEDVVQLRDRLGFPGLRVLQFGFGLEEGSKYFLPEQYVENCVAYTGTHDNDTICGWFDDRASVDGTRTADDIAREHKAVLALLGTDGSKINWDCIKLLLDSRAGAVVFPLQDVLGLGSAARMNTPGKRDGNWRWRFGWEQLTDEVQQRLATLTRGASRNVHMQQPEAASRSVGAATQEG